MFDRYVFGVQKDRTSGGPGCLESCTTHGGQELSELRKHDCIDNDDFSMTFLVMTSDYSSHQVRLRVVCCRCFFSKDHTQCT